MDILEELKKACGHKNNPEKPKEGASIEELIRNMEHNAKLIKNAKDQWRMPRREKL